MFRLIFRGSHPQTVENVKYFESRMDRLTGRYIIYYETPIVSVLDQDGYEVILDEYDEFTVEAKGAP